jgi:dihydrofolate reductase
MRTGISIIVAASQNNVIGVDGKLPWNIPEDLKHFKNYTMGSAMVMGRKTFESLPGVLPGRIHIVLTRDKEWKPSKPDSQVLVCHSLTDLMSMIVNFPNLVVIGGGEIYQLLLPYVTEIMLTRVNVICEGDTTFSVPASDFEAIDFTRRPHTKNDDGSHGPSYSFVKFKRVRETAKVGRGLTTSFVHLD